MCISWYFHTKYILLCNLLFTMHIYLHDRFGVPTDANGFESERIAHDLTWERVANTHGG